MSVVHDRAHSRQNDVSWPIRLWLGTGAAALALGLALCTGHAVASAESGDGTTTRGNDTSAGKRSVGPAAKRSTEPRFGTDNAAAVRVPSSTPSTLPSRLRPRVAPAASVAGGVDTETRAVPSAGSERIVESLAVPDRAQLQLANSVAGQPPAAASAVTTETESPTRPVARFIESLSLLARQVNEGSAQAVVRYRNIAYGESPKEKLDVYAPPGAVDAPMILMVHGGGWSFGDKANRGLVRNKVDHFVPEGALFISANYPLLPGLAPDGQADSVAAAIAYVQAHAAEWGGDPDNLVIMGHSAGGHLVALVSAQSDRYPDLRPWQGTVVLDSAALDLVARMENRPPPLFRRAFGSDPAYWESVSPLLALHRSTEPLLLVCASRRSDSCPQAQVFATAASSFGTEVQVLPQDLTHRQINVTLGRPGGYTDAVDSFLRGAWMTDQPSVV